MKEVVAQALARWQMADARVALAAHRENMVFRVAHAGRTFALRLHRKGYRSDIELASELDWMAAAAKGGIHVPCPIASASGRFLEHVAGWQVDVLTWLSGETLATAMIGATPRRRAEIFSDLGREMARFHQVCDAWSPPDGFDRAAWDRGGLAGRNPVWGRFWENPALTPADAALFAGFRARAELELGAIEGKLDYGLIHADLLGENVLVDGATIKLIDFDDGGPGFRVFDLVTALIKLIDDPDYGTLKDALWDGYRAVRPLDTAGFDLMMALRATTYVGWIADRTDLPDAATRQRINATRARRLINRYLGSG